jgi:hypothetical protein
MKPNPFSGLNHFTVPVAMSLPLLPRPARTCCGVARPSATGDAGRELLQPEL